jgi:two-component system sensor histidine kinase QseC
LYDDFTLTLPHDLPLGLQKIRIGTKDIIVSSRLDPHSKLIVRVMEPDNRGFWLHNGNYTFYVLPLIVSLPFLIIPVWLMAKMGIRPINELANELDAREESNLQPISPPAYRELALLNGSINDLLARLRNRLELEREFLVDAAHELKTPLAIIQVNAEALIEPNDPERRQAAALGLIAGVERSAHAVHQLLAYARAAGDVVDILKTTVDLVDVLQERAALFYTMAAAKNVDVELSESAPIPIVVDYESVIQLFDNLLGNAIKYSPEGGLVTIKLCATDKVINVMFEDEGPGIPVEYREKIFQRFFRIPGQEETGSGLGLAIAERAAERNAAHIQLNTGARTGGLEAVVTFDLAA